MENLTDWLMIIITGIYVVATIFIWNSNKQSAKAATEAVEESKNQFNQNLELQRQHNYDSVRPAVSLDYSSDVNDHIYGGSIKITNHGLGPAIIKGLNFKNDNGKRYSNMKEYFTFLDLINERVEETGVELKTKDVFHSYYSKDFRNSDIDTSFLGVGETLPLIEFEARNKNEADAVVKIFDGLSAKLIYTDIYKSHDWIISKRLTYFVHSWKYSCNVSRVD